MISSESFISNSNHGMQQYAKKEDDSLHLSFANGDIDLPKTLSIFPPMKLTRPTLLGSGGGGAVFAYHQESDTLSTQSKSQKYTKSQPNSDVAVKISWVKSASSVENECKILQTLEQTKTRNVEVCLGIQRYPEDHRRVMIALQPVMDGKLDGSSSLSSTIVASISELPTREIQSKSIRLILQTLLDMMASNIVTADVQPLISTTTGQVLFIDLTEAQVMTKNEPTSQDFALASSFCSEIMALIPESFYQVSSQILVDEFRTLWTVRGTDCLSETLYDLVIDSASFLTPDDIEKIAQMRENLGNG